METVNEFVTRMQEFSKIWFRIQNKNRSWDPWNPFTDYGKQYTQIGIKYHYADDSIESRGASITALKNMIKSHFGEGSQSGRKPHLFLSTHINQGKMEGIVLKNDIKIIAAEMLEMKLESICFYLYNDIYFISDDDYKEYLESQRENINLALMSCIPTIDKSQEYTQRQIIKDILSIFSIPHFGDKDTDYDKRFCEDILASLAARGCIHQAVYNGVPCVWKLSPDDWAEKIEWQKNKFCH